MWFSLRFISTFTYIKSYENPRKGSFNNCLLTYDSSGPVYSRFHRAEWITWASGVRGPWTLLGPEMARQNGLQQWGDPKMYVHKMVLGLRKGFERRLTLHIYRLIILHQLIRSKISIQAVLKIIKELESICIQQPKL
jgi:hypothetical protein